MAKNQVNLQHNTQRDGHIETVSVKKTSNGDGNETTKDNGAGRAALDKNQLRDIKTTKQKDSFVPQIRKPNTVKN